MRSRACVGERHGNLGNTAHRQWKQRTDKHGVVIGFDVLQ